MADLPFFKPPASGGSGGKSRTAPATLLASGWANGRQTLIIDGLDASQNGSLDPANGLTDEQRGALANAGLEIGGQRPGALDVVSTGLVPTCDIPVVVTLFP